MLEVEDKEKSVWVETREVLVAVVLSNSWEIISFLNLAWDVVLGVINFLVPHHGAVLVRCLEEIKDGAVSRIFFIVSQVYAVLVNNVRFLVLAFHRWRRTQR